MLDRFKVPEKDKIYVPVERITAVTENILKASGVSEEGAKNSTAVLIGNDLRGVETHGVSNGGFMLRSMPRVVTILSQI